MDRASSRLAVLSTHLATPVQESLHCIAAQACSAPGKLLDGKVLLSSVLIAFRDHILRQHLASELWKTRFARASLELASTNLVMI